MLLLGGNFGISKRMKPSVGAILTDRLLLLNE